VTAPTQRVLYIISCASPAAAHVPRLVELTHAAGWHVCVIASPQGRKFLDIPRLEELTGYPVRSEYKHPDEPDILPRADAVVAFPATFNTLNKWALGISDTLAVGLLCEYTGFGKPVIAVPCVGTNSGLDSHPAFQRSLAQLADYGVHIIYDRDTYSMNDPTLPDTAASHLACLNVFTSTGA
jgi:phosphopantothenoylcysteine synthetase/decarboxylase